MAALRIRKGWRIVLVAVAIIVGLAIAMVYVLRGVRQDRASAPVAVGTGSRPPPVRVSPEPGNGLEGEALERIAALLHSDQAFGRDVAFLLAASVRERCNPAHAGELAKMAGRARLPVLAATSEVTAQAPDLDRPIYLFVQRVADAAPCGRALDLEPSGLEWTLDPEAYAAAFPDSYYRPALSSVPAEYGGASLEQRASQGCQSIAYAVVPLAAPDWRCSGLDASTRRRILAVCEQERAGTAGGADADEVPVEAAQRITAEVAQIVDRLPENCR